MARGIDPFAWDYPVAGFPDAADVSPTPHHRHSDEFLEEIAREYLAIGRGHARAIGFERGVSARTVVNWVEKARKRGILTSVRQGQFGGEIVSPARRR